MLVKNHSVRDFLRQYGFVDNKNIRILNAGSSSVRYGPACINVDIQQKPNVDLICDIHNLPASPSAFDVVICNAVLQYCHNPYTVAGEFLRVLKPGGFLYVDAPWMQPYCPDTPDRFRFSADGLRAVFAGFEIVEIGPSIRPGSAFAFLGTQMAHHLTANKYINRLMAIMATVVFYPFRRVRTHDEHRTAGAFYMICRKPL
jgi:SAM-dependent methyltransferase